MLGGRIRHSDTLSVPQWGVFLQFSRVSLCHVDNYLKKVLDIMIYLSYILNVEILPFFGGEKQGGFCTIIGQIPTNK